MVSDQNQFRIYVDVENVTNLLLMRVLHDGLRVRHRRLVGGNDLKNIRKNHEIFLTFAFILEENMNNGQIFFFTLV